ncbi:MAG TPA: paraquat-inducible protein A [Kiloniellaceae bacterium]|nr:paraquat-inducible protein A [Kiloniellaceae bacterium]
MAKTPPGEPPRAAHRAEPEPEAAAQGLTGGRNWALGSLLVTAAASLLAGWIMPVMTVETLFVFNDQISILGACFHLLEDGELPLFLIVLVFTVIFPATKLAFAFDAWVRLRRADAKLLRSLHWLESLGKWSMLDVFVIALLVVVVKLSSVSDVTVHLGLYVFALAVILSMVSVKAIAVLARANGAGTNATNNIKK